MCQYSAENGNPSQWHYGHLQALSLTGAGMLMFESTAVNLQGRITHHDLTLYNRNNEKSLRTAVNYLRSLSKIPLGLQISHSGRKGSAHVPWIRNNDALKNHEDAWTTVAPSSIERASDWPKPEPLTVNQINGIKSDFENAALRANRIGFDGLEIHMAHGYLLHQFFSPISNIRTDEYGGSLEKRCRLLVEITAKVRKAWPENKILGARITGSDWLDGGITIDDTVYLVQRLQALGLDYVCVSSGGVIPKTNLIFKSGYQIHLASEIKKRTGIITRVAGLITNYSQASDVIEKGSADLVALGRKFISEPNWLNHAIKLEKGVIRVPNQYKRCF